MESVGEKVTNLPERPVSDAARQAGGYHLDAPIEEEGTENPDHPEVTGGPTEGVNPKKLMAQETRELEDNHQFTVLRTGWAKSNMEHECASGHHRIKEGEVYHLTVYTDTSNTIHSQRWCERHWYL